MKKAFKIEVKRTINNTGETMKKAFEFVKSLFKMKAFDPAQLETAKTEIFTAVSTGVKDHLITYGVEEAAAQAQADFCGELIKLVYQYSLSEEEVAEEPTAAEDAPIESDAAKSVKMFIKSFAAVEEKAGSAHSAETKAAVKELADLSSSFNKKMKAFNDKVHKADVKPEDGEKDIEPAETKQVGTKSIKLADWYGTSVN